MSYLYLSYSPKQQTAIQALTEKLIARGFDVWGGEKSGLEQCGACLVIMTPDSSTDARVMDDTREAHTLGKVVIPLLMAGEVFSAYAATPYIDMRGTPDAPPAAFWNRLKEAVGERAGRGAFMTEDEKIDDDSSMVTHITKPARLRDLAQALRASTTPPPMAASPVPPKTNS